MINLMMRYLGRDAVFFANEGAGGGAGNAGGAGADAGAGGVVDAAAGAVAGVDPAKATTDADKAGTKDTPAADKGGAADGGDKGKPAAAGDVLGEAPPAKIDGEKPDKEKAEPPANETADQKIAREKSEKEAADKAAADKLEAEKKEAEKKAAEKVPKDGYKLDAKEAGLPDGFVVDEKAKALLDPVAAELNLDQPSYNKLAGVYAKVKEGELAAFADTVKGWKDTAMKDSEIGGDKWDQAVIDARALLADYGTPELRHYLFYSGNGNHPELIRCFAKLGASVRQGQGVIPANKGGKSASQGDRLYGTPAGA